METLLRTLQIFDTYLHNTESSYALNYLFLMDTSLRAMDLSRCSMEYTPSRQLAREFKLETVRQTALSEMPKSRVAGSWACVSVSWEMAA